MDFVSEAITTLGAATKDGFRSFDVMNPPDEGVSLEDVEKELLLAALQKHNWNQTRAANYLRITRSTLLYRMQKFGLERPRSADHTPTDGDTDVEPPTGARESRGS